MEVFYFGIEESKLGNQLIFLQEKVFNKKVLSDSTTQSSSHVINYIDEGFVSTSISCI